MRGSIGIEGLMELCKFVQQGGLLITEGGTSTVFPELTHAGRERRADRRSLRAWLGPEGAAR
jgi:hypothetical protein